jgi:pSer/pThr/pTyr-binding forkhead associated (FHA) protein
MKNRVENKLIVIEKGKIFTYNLDDKLSWTVGRVTTENNPDIKLSLSTVSRKHGELTNIDGNWFYMDFNGKNGTVYNNKQIKPGIYGKIKPVILKNGDTLIFGGGSEAVINSKTVWAKFITSSIEGAWRVNDTAGYSHITFNDGNEKIRMDSPKKGTVLEKENGIAIYMGDFTYLLGNIEVSGE